jgi:hypothetical protein
MTPDYLTIILAVVFGFLLRHAVITDTRMREARRWLKIRTPRRCSLCGSWHQARKMKAAEHKPAGWVLICKTCYNQEYIPFSEARRGRKQPESKE